MIIRELIGFRPRVDGHGAVGGGAFPDGRRRRSAARRSCSRISWIRHGDERGVRRRPENRRQQARPGGYPRLRSAAKPNCPTWASPSCRTPRRGAQGLGRHFVGGPCATITPASWRQRSEAIDSTAQTQPHRHGDDLDRRRLRGGTHQTLQATMKRPAFLTAAAGRPARCGDGLPPRRPTVDGAHRPRQHRASATRFDARNRRRARPGAGDRIPALRPKRRQARSGRSRCPSTRSRGRAGGSGCANATVMAGLLRRHVTTLGRPGVLYADKNIVDTLRSLRFGAGWRWRTFQIDSAVAVDLRPQTAADAAAALPRRSQDTFSAGCSCLLNLAALLFALRYHLSKPRQTPRATCFKPAPPATAPRRGDPARSKGFTTRNCGRTTNTRPYYSGLTDILRTLSGGALRHRRLGDDLRRDHRCGASARPAPTRARMELTALLREADLVKFAKATPEAARNEAGLPVGLLLRRGDQTRRGTTSGRSGGAARPDA